MDIFGPNFNLSFYNQYPRDPLKVEIRFEIYVKRQK